MNSLFRNYKNQIIFCIMSLLLLILVVVNIVTYSMIKRATERQLGLGAQGVAVAATLLISSDLDSYRAFLDTRDVNSEYYRRMQSLLAQIKKDNNIQFIYTANRIDETTSEFILDAEPVGSENYSAPGDIEEFNVETLEAYRSKRPALLPPTHSDFGILLGCSAPILDENGSVIGTVGVNIDNSAVFTSLKSWFVVLIVMCGLLLVLIGFLLSKVTNFFLESMLKDKLTGAYNKRYTDPLLQKCMDNALKSNQILSIMMLDLDHFKKINDTYGHHFGDVVLSKTSSMISDCLRKDDFLVRYGGEEFLAILFNLNPNTALTVAERIRKRIETAEIFNEENNIGVKITISIGVTSLGQKKITALDLVNNADKALYKAKETRNAVATLNEGGLSQNQWQ